MGSPAVSVLAGQPSGGRQMVEVFISSGWLASSEVAGWLFHLY
jgi:hypothetical protein